MSKITDFERATIRLRAFELLKGWGDAAPDAEKSTARLTTPWNLERHKEVAESLADWAIGDVE